MKSSVSLQIKSTKPDKFTPKIVEQKDDYLLVEYETPIIGVCLSFKLIWSIDNLLALTENDQLLWTN